MGPDPTRAYFWPAVNKRPTRLWPGYFPTQPEEIFSDPLKGKKFKNLMFLGEIFPIQTQTINGWPDPTQVKNFWPGPITSRLAKSPKAINTFLGVPPLRSMIIANYYFTDCKKCWSLVDFYLQSRLKNAWITGDWTHNLSYILILNQVAMTTHSATAMWCIEMTSRKSDSIIIIGMANVSGSCPKRL